MDGPKPTPKSLLAGAAGAVWMLALAAVVRACLGEATPFYALGALFGAMLVILGVIESVTEGGRSRD